MKIIYSDVFFARWLYSSFLATAILAIIVGFSMRSLFYTVETFFTLIIFVSMVTMTLLLLDFEHEVAIQKAKDHKNR